MMLKLKHTMNKRLIATTAKSSPSLSKTNTVHDDKTAHLGEKDCCH
jgi:hypothetical protein